LVRTTTKKPIARRASVARRDKSVAAPAIIEAKKEPVKKEPVKTPVKTQEVAPQPAPVRTPAPAVEMRAEPAVAPVKAPFAAETASTARPPAQAEPTKGISIMTDVTETAKTYADEAKNRFQGAVAELNEKAKTAVEKSAKLFEELGDLTKGNVEAVVESSRIAAKGVETLSQDAVEFSRKSFEKSTATFKSFAAVKTPADFFQLQSELLSSSLDSFAAQAARNSEAVLKLVGDVAKPLSNRVAVVTDKVKSLAA